MKPVSGHGDFIDTVFFANSVLTGRVIFVGVIFGLVLTAGDNPVRAEAMM